MADRLPTQFNMLPGQYNPSLVGQQGLQPGLLPQQSHPPTQVDTTQSVSGLSNPEHGRMWQQMQQQQRLVQFRQQVGGADIGGPVNVNQQQQMLDFLRSRNPSQNQQQQQPQKQFPPSFLGGPGPMNPGAASFHDPTQPSGFPHNGNNMPMNGNSQFNMNALQALAARNPSVGMQLQALQNGGGSTDLTRQINMLGMAHNQRTQDQSAGGANFTTLRQLQHQQQQMSMQASNQPQSSMPPQGQPSLANMNSVPGSMSQMGLGPLNGQPQPQPSFFGGPGVGGAPNGMRSSPPQGNMQSNPTAVGLRPQGMIPGSKFNFEDLKNRAIMVQKALKDMEARKAALTSQLATSPNTGLEVEIARTDKAILEHRQLFQRIAQMVRAATQGMTPPNGGPSGEMSNMNHVGASAPAPQPTQQTPNMQQPPNWLQQQGPSPPNSFPGTQMPQQPGQMMPSRSPQAPNMQAANPNPAAPPMNRNMLGQMGGLPNRTMTTPLQMLNPGAQNPPQSSPNMPSMMANPSFNQPGTATSISAAVNSVPTQSQGQPSMESRAQLQLQDAMNAQRGGIAPLSLQTFTQAYRAWTAQQKNLKDERLLSWENRQIDLYSLHCEVMKLGGPQRVLPSDQWPFIGAKLGFVNFPATATEPARCGPGVAQHIQHVYKEFLLPFDNTYLASLAHRLKPGDNQGMGPQRGAPVPGSSAMSLAPNGMQVQNGLMQGRPMPNNPGFPGIGMQSENILQNVSQLTGISEPQTVQQLIGWSMQSNDQLRQLGVDPRLIEKVELHRATLQRTYHAQQAFRNQLRENQLAAATQVQRQRMLAQAQQQQQQKPGVPSPVGGGVMRQPDIQLLPQQQQGPQQPQQQPQPPLGFAGPDGRQFVRRRLSPEELTKALAFIMKVKGEYTERTKGLREVAVPEHERLDYNTAFEQLYRLVTDTEPKMHFYASYLREEGTRKLLAVIATAQHQRALLSSSTPKYILDMKTVRSMTEQVMSAQQGAQAYLALAAGPQNQQLLQPPQQPQPPDSNHQQAPSQVAIVPPPRPPTHPPQPQPPPQISRRTPQPPQAHPPPQTTPLLPPAVVATTSSPAQHPQHPHSTPILPPNQIKKKPGAPPTPQPIDLVAVTPTPPASASTPAAGAPTPTAVAASSPQTPKSPKTKAQPKTKAPPKRKPSKAAAPPPVPPPTQTSAPAPPPPTATAPPPAPVAAPAPPPAALTPATPNAPPVDTPTPSSEGGVKRRREDEAPTLAPLNEPSPPKKIKTEWEGPLSEELVKREQELDSIKTDEDASKFFERMSEMLKNSGEGQEPWPSQISDSLDQILKVYGGSSDLGGPSMSSLLAEGSSSGGMRASPPPHHVSSGLDGMDFFDFSSYSGMDEDSGSKAPTPELVSQLGPSPESGSETEGGPSSLMDTTRVTDSVKMEELGDASDALRSGQWKEIDGGESSYYQHLDWKWDGPMQEQTWAFS